MNKLNVNLENCYGISKLNTEFDFTNSTVKIIYASNGCMKTSFAKTFRDFANNVKPKDEIDPDKTPVCSLIDENGTEISKNIFVIDSYNESYSSREKMNTLLVQEDLKIEYIEILKSIEEKKTELFKEIKRLSGSSNSEKEILETFNEKNIFEAILKINESIEDKEFVEFTFKYNDIINLKVKEFLKANQTLLDEYLSRYSELISDSSIYEKGIFGTDNVKNIKKSLGENGFFNARHKLVLRDLSEITNEESLEQLIKKEKERIFSDNVLVKKFETLDDKITKNIELKKLKSILETSPELLTKLADFDDFTKKMWFNYFVGAKELLNNLINEYLSSQEKIKSIIGKAHEQKTTWNSVIELFNNRFDVPFLLSISNQDDVILKESAPNLQFTYKDKPIDESKLKSNVLSGGEKRALYLLYIIFEIEALRKNGSEFLLIFDDIADSFDYRNKYAIIEYLKDVIETTTFKTILLTHNFDFYRTVSSRMNLGKNCLMTIKTDDEIKIEQGKYVYNLFGNWIKELEKNERIFIASIPFVRNLIEYIKGKDDLDYLALTNLLHNKPTTKEYTVSSLGVIYNKFWNGKIYSNPDHKIFDIIIHNAETINRELEDKIQLENKIVLSIAIRLLAEEYMISIINNQAEIDKIAGNQTLELLRKCKKKISDNSILQILERVNMMTAENIHINAFMYEPLLDLSDSYLKKLYCDVKHLNT